MPRRRVMASVEVYRRDVVVRVKVGSGSRVAAVRGVVKGLSPKSARELLLRGRNLVGLGVLVTLTYPGVFPSDGRVVKRHLNSFVQWLKRRGIGGLWVLEFQRRGAPHYHILVNGELDRHAVAFEWFTLVGSRDLRHLAAGTRVEGLRSENAAAAYVAKYVSKQEQKAVPNGFEGVGRMWGTFGVTLERTVVVGERADLVPIIRHVRRADRARRRSVGQARRRYRGVAGFGARDVAAVVRPFVDAARGAAGGESGGSAPS